MHILFFSIAILLSISVAQAQETCQIREIAAVAPAYFVWCDGTRQALTQAAYTASQRIKDFCPLPTDAVWAVGGADQYNTTSGDPEHCDVLISPNGAAARIIAHQDGDIELQASDLRREGSGRLSVIRSIPGITLIDGILTREERRP